MYYIGLRSKFNQIVGAIFEKINISYIFLMWTTLNFRGRGKTRKKTARDVYKRTLDIEFEVDRSIGLGHGRARVAHCVTRRWRNVSHYCRPLGLIYVFWAQRSTARCADSTRCIQTRVYSARRKYIVRHRTSREASLRHCSGWGTWSVSPQYRDLRTRGLGSTIGDGQTDRHTHTHRHFFWNTCLDCGSDVEAKMIKKNPIFHSL